MCMNKMSGTHHGVSQVLRGVVRDVEQLPVLRHHHQEPAQRLQSPQNKLTQGWNTQLLCISGRTFGL